MYQNASLFRAFSHVLPSTGIPTGITRCAVALTGIRRGQTRQSQERRSLITKANRSDAGALVGSGV